MGLLNDLILDGKDPGKFMAEELQEAILPVTTRVDDLSVKLDRIESLLVKINTTFTLLEPLAALISKIPFFRTLSK